MAEIPIQRKEGRNIWPMLIGLLVLLAILWFVFSRRNNSNTAAASGNSTSVASNGGVTTDSSAGTTANGMAGGAGGAAAGAGAAGAGAGAAGTSGSGGSGAGGSGSGASGPSGAALDDASILAVLHAANQGEVTAGRLAQTKASNSDVKSFAREMVKDHGAMDAKGTKLTSAVGGSSGGASGAGAGGASGSSGGASGASGASGSAGSPIADSVTSANQAVSSQLQNAGSGAAFDRAYMDSQVQAHQNTLTFLQQAQNSAQNADLKQMITQAIPDVQKHLDRARALQSKVGGQ